MTKVPKIFWIIGGVLFAVASIAIHYEVKFVMHHQSVGAVREMGNVKDGELAPDFSLPDLSSNTVTLSSYRGQKVVLLDFWATWCGPCVGEIPGYIELQKKYGPDGLVIVGIAYRDFKGPAHVKKFAEEKGMNYLLVIGDENVADAFGGIEGIPSTFLINRQGLIVHHKMGAMPHDEYEKLVKQALN